MFCNHSVVPCVCRIRISAIAVCHIWRITFVIYYVGTGLNMLTFAALVAHSLALHDAALLQHRCSH